MRIRVDAFMRTLPEAARLIRTQREERIVQQGSLVRRIQHMGQRERRYAERRKGRRLEVEE